MAESSGRVAESALPSLHFFNHSRFNAIGSEIISGSSLPSEPPDIGSWFSSYVYESPVLDTEDGVKDVVSGGSEWQKDGFISQEIGREKKKKMELWNHSHKDASAFAPIKSFSVNENEKNQSPDEGKCNSHVTKKGESENLDTKMLKDHGFVPLYDVDSSQELDDEFSVPSEPPDIANWFSSYCYESPALDTGEELNDYVSRENESEKVIFTSEEFSRTKEDDPGKLINDASVLLGQDDEHQNQSMNKGDSNLLVIGDSESLAGKPVKTHDLNPFKDNATSCLTNVDSPQNLKTNLSAEVNCLTSTLKKSSSANHKEAKDNPHEMKNSEENHLKGKALGRGFDHHHEDSTSLRSEKEQGRDITTNGFVSTRKKSFTSQNDRSYIKSCEKKKNDTEMRTSLARKPLLERTNIRDEVVVAPAITGKWKCPQRSKPDVGPPMKQQRLERWIHRV